MKVGKSVGDKGEVGGGGIEEGGVRGRTKRRQSERTNLWETVVRVEKRSSD